MGQFADETAKRAKKLNELVSEMRKMDEFRDDVNSRTNRKSMKVAVIVRDGNGDYPTELDIDNFDGLRENILGLTDLAIRKRYDEIRKILKDEFGGAWVTVKEDSR